MKILKNIVWSSVLLLACGSAITIAQQLAEIYESLAASRRAVAA